MKCSIYKAVAHLLSLLALVAEPHLQQVMAAEPALSQLEVRVKDFRNNQGGFLVAVFTQEAVFRKWDEAIAQIYVDQIGTDQSGRVVFKDLTAGIKYGVAVFHDENANRKFDKTFFGVPKEGQGASNGAVGFHGPPTFSDAAFLLNESVKSITIDIHY